MRQKRKRMGAPPKPAKDKQAKVVQVSFTEAALKPLVTICDGRPLATYLRVSRAL